VIVGLPKTDTCRITAERLEDGGVFVRLEAEGTTLAPVHFQPTRYVKANARAYIDLLANVCRRYHGISNVIIEDGGVS
jgi:hypothetical protein